MKAHIAEFVSPGHPDRLADAIVEAVVDLAVGRDADALVGVECAVHTDQVFIDGRIAAGAGDACAVRHDEIEEIARKVYREAGYGGIWIHAPERLKVMQNVCLGPLSDDERAIRNLSDDQNVVVGYACNHPETAYLPPAHFVANYLGRKVDAWRRTVPGKFGPDFKVLVQLDDAHGRYEWRRLTLSIQHRPGVFAAEQHELVLPVVRGALAELAARGLAGISDLSLDDFVLNGMGDFIVGGPEGDNGLSGKKLAVDFYGPEIPIGGGAICGKDPHKVDVAGAFRARELALRLLQEGGGNAVTVRLGWTPGDAAPAFRAAERVDSIGLAHPIPATALPSADWFRLDTIVSAMRLTSLVRRERVLAGYFFGADTSRNYTTSRTFHTRGH
ncbi:MAG: methionine adenosyltransferase domain-containing protein [Kiritimatiellia bacterium]